MQRSNTQEERLPVVSGDEGVVSVLFHEPADMLRVGGVKGAEPLVLFMSESHERLLSEPLFRQGLFLIAASASRVSPRALRCALVKGRKSETLNNYAPIHTDMN